MKPTNQSSSSTIVMVQSMGLSCDFDGEHSRYMVSCELWGWGCQWIGSKVDFEGAE
jgi:hypothetical protein